MQDGTESTTISATCCVAGGGPAGVMLGLLLAKAGIDVVVNGNRLTPVDFATLRGPNRHIAMMPQWDFLTLLAEEGARHPGFRAASGLETREFGVPVDVLWFRVSTPAAPPPDTLAYITSSAMVITIPRAGYYQAAMLILKGAFPAIQDAVATARILAAPLRAGTLSPADLKRD